MNSSKIHISAFYKAHQQQIESSLYQTGCLCSLNSVSTVTSFQGLECDVIILSCARSLKASDRENMTFFTHDEMRRFMGFVQDFHRLNVSISHGKDALIILGDVQLLQRVPVWTGLVAHFQQRNYMVDDSIFEKLDTN